MAASSAAALLPPIIGVSREDASYWSGPGRYEHGDRRNHALVHWSYGARVDVARLRRLRAMLDARWKGRRGKRFATSLAILDLIALGYNSTEKISRITKASIAAKLKLHRNTVYQHCKAMEEAGVLVQGYYEASKGSAYKRYSVFAISGITGRLPMILTFRRKYSRHARIIEINWPTRHLAEYGRRPCRLFPETPATSKAGSSPSPAPALDLSKNVHRTCNQQLFLFPIVPKHPDQGRVLPVPGTPTAKDGYGTAPGGRQIMSMAAGGGRNPRRTPAFHLKRITRAGRDCHEGGAWQIPHPCSDRQQTGIKRIRGLMKGFEMSFGHLASYRPVTGFPRDWMRRRALDITPDQWKQLTDLVLSRPMLTGEAMMASGRMFDLNFYWLIKHATRLLAAAQPPTVAATNPQPASTRSTDTPPGYDRDAAIAEHARRNPELGATLAEWATDLDAANQNSDRHDRPDDELARGQDTSPSDTNHNNKEN